MHRQRRGAVLACLALGALAAPPPVASGHTTRSQVAAVGLVRTPDVGCTLDLTQRPHVSTTARRKGRSEVAWKVTVSCFYGKIVAGRFVSSGVRAVVEFIHIRLALYRNGQGVGLGTRDKPAVSTLTATAAGPCTVGALYQGWGKGLAVLPPGVRDVHNGTRFSIAQGWGDQRRIRRCA